MQKSLKGSLTIMTSVLLSKDVKLDDFFFINLFQHLESKQKLA